MGGGILSASTDQLEAARVLPINPPSKNCLWSPWQQGTWSCSAGNLFRGTGFLLIGPYSFHLICLLTPANQVQLAGHSLPVCSALSGRLVRVDFWSSGISSLMGGISPQQRKTSQACSSDEETHCFCQLLSHPNPCRQLLSVGIPPLPFFFFHSSHHSYVCKVLPIWPMSSARPLCSQPGKTRNGYITNSKKNIPTIFYPFFKFG